MKLLESEEVHASRPETLDDPDLLARGEWWLEVTGVLRQIFRLGLLTWSLLCFFCCVRLCLNARGIDASALLANLFIGLTAWFLACRIGANSWRDAP